VLSTFAQCNVTGTGWGCAWASASEEGHAKALYNAWNVAKGDPAFTSQGCSCLITKFSTTHSTWEAWKGLARQAKVWLESSVCQFGTLCLQQLLGPHHSTLHPVSAAVAATTAANAIAILMLELSSGTPLQCRCGSTERSICTLCCVPC
jgi:hypothetical protein